jgi:hypothetical protein
MEASKMKKLLFIAILLFSLLATGVTAAIDLTATTEPITLSGSPGANFNGQFQVHNSESANHTVTFTGYTLTHTSDNSKTMNINSISDVAVTTGSSQTVNYAIANTNVYSGTYSGALVGTSTTNSALTDNIQYQVTINANPGASVTSPTFSAGRGIARTISISVSDLSDGINTLPQSYISFNPSSTSINFGASAVNVDVTTNIPATQVTGTYTGTVTANYGSGTATSTLSITVRDPLHEVKVGGDEVNLGSATQERNATLQQSFTVQNSGDYSEQVDLTLSGIKSKYNAQLSTAQFTLQPGQIQQVTVTLVVPDDQSSGKQKIGNIQVVYNQQTSTIPLNLETVSKLEIDEIETEVGGEESDSNLDDGETLSEEAKPGDEIEFQIKVKNLFTSSEGFKIEDITIEVIPDDDDIDEEDLSEKFDVKADRISSQKTLTIKVPEKFNEGEYDVDILIEGQDENNAVHTIEWTVTFKVEKDKNDVRISEASFGAETLSCVRSTDLRIVIANYGSEDQEEAALAIFSSELGINENVQDIYLDSDYEDSDNDFTKTITVSVGDNFAAGTYPITIKVFRDTDREMDQKIINLKVEDCPVSEPEDTSDTTVVITPPTGSTDQTGGQTDSSATSVVETVETSFTNSTAFILMLASINLIVLLVILVLVFKFLI